MKIHVNPTHFWEKGRKRRKDPNAPKRPLSAYFLFSKEEFSNMKVKYPSYTVSEIAKELGLRWAIMPPEVKSRYQQMAMEGKQKYYESIKVLFS